MAYTFCNAVDCRSELALELHRWTRARSECLPGEGNNYSYATRRYTGYAFRNLWFTLYTYGLNGLIRKGEKHPTDTPPNSTALFTLSVRTRTFQNDVERR